MTEQTVGQEAATESLPVSAEERAFYERHAEPAPAPAETAPPATAPAVPVDEAGDDDGDADEKGDNRGRFVRRESVERARERQRQAEARLQEREIEFAKVNERLAILTAAMQPQKAAETAPPVTPDLETDPIGYIKHLGEQLQQNGRQTEEMRRAAEAERETQAVVSTYQTDAARFAQETPDFRDAYGHLLQGRDRELALYGIADPQQRAQIINQEEQQLVRTALAQGKRPAQVVYEMAKARGYAGAPPAPAAPSPVQEVQRIAEAAKANRSLSNMSGSGAQTTLTAQDLLAMDDKQFAALEESVKRRLMGG